MALVVLNYASSKVIVYNNVNFNNNDDVEDFIVENNMNLDEVEYMFSNHIELNFVGTNSLTIK